MALVIAEFQCDVLIAVRKKFWRNFYHWMLRTGLPVGTLRLDWLSICPSIGKGVKHHADVV
jgi:hypothetical protein